ncbi:hypothetical protein SARC_16750, partial [Sphaeroforma arctica JP610]
MKTTGDDAGEMVRKEDARTNEMCDTDMKTTDDDTGEMVRKEDARTNEVCDTNKKTTSDDAGALVPMTTDLERSCTQEGLTSTNLLLQDVCGCLKADQQ